MAAGIGKHRALRCAVTCNLRLYFEIERNRVKPSYSSKYQVETTIVFSYIKYPVTLF